MHFTAIGSQFGDERATEPNGSQSDNGVVPNNVDGRRCSGITFADALGGQQHRGDGCPFCRQITGCWRATCLPIPIIGIVEIALNAVQVSVNPRAVRAFAFGDNLVRLIPIVFACPPKRYQRRQKPVWRLPSRETMLEVRWGHDRILDVQNRGYLLIVAAPAKHTTSS